MSKLSSDPLYMINAVHRIGRELIMLHFKMIQMHFLVKCTIQKRYILIIVSYALAYKFLLHGKK